MTIDMCLAFQLEAYRLLTKESQQRILANFEKVLLPVSELWRYEC